MSPEQIAALATSLQQSRRHVIAAIRQHLHQSDQPEERALANRFGEDDRAAAELVGELGIAQLHHESEELKDLDAALQRIADGSYGTCIQCGEPIPFERMSAQPVAAACLACQKDVEQRHGTWSRR